MPTHRVAVLDTDVWSNLYAHQRETPNVAEWRRLLLGVTVVIAAHSRAEVLGGLLWHPVGPEREARIRQQLEKTPTVPVDEDVVQACARLYAEARRSGHCLGQKIHTNDRWIAATAIAIDAPLLALDGVFRGAPRLELLGEPENTGV